MKTTLRLLQISDLHLARRRSERRYLEERIRQKVADKNPFCRPASHHLIRATARTLYEMQDMYDAVLITGDLATSGAREDLEMALAFIEGAPSHDLPWREPRRPLATLGALERQIFLMPGNHDRYRDQIGEPGGREFDDVFSDYWSVGQGVKAFSEICDHLAIVACDLTLTEDVDLPRLFRPGRGMAYKDRLEMLRKETDRLRRERPERAVLWAIHFPPKFLAACSELSLIQRGKLELLELMDDDLLVRMARDAGVSRILCGHTHWAKYYPVDEEARIFVHCAGSATQKEADYDAPNTLHLIDIEVDDGQIVHFDPRELTYLPGRDQFVYK